MQSRINMAGSAALMSLSTPLDLSQEEFTIGYEQKDVFKNTFTANFKQERVNSETDITSYKTTETLTHTFGPGCYCPAGIPDNSYVS